MAAFLACMIASDFAPLVHKQALQAWQRRVEACPDQWFRYDSFELTEQVCQKLGTVCDSVLPRLSALACMHPVYWELTLLHAVMR